MYIDISELVGKTFTTVRDISGDEIQFISDTGPSYRMFHSQDCCERVYVEDINGDLADLAGTPIVVAEELSNEPEPEEPHDDESQTWTFYRLGTIKGTVTIRWYGSSNGYYSESVDIERM